VTLGSPADAGRDNMPLMEHDEVLLSVPGSADYLRLVRLAAADAATRAGFTVDDVEDLRIAVDELCFALAEDDGARRLELRFRVAGAAVEVEGRCEHGDPEFSLGDLATVIVGAVVDEYSIGVDAGSRWFRAGKSTSTG
jgi:serine/threonine-protein kinase RsbW